MGRAKDDRFFGVLFYNSNAQQFQIRHSRSGKSVVNWRSIGGIMDMYFIYGGTADDVIKQYNELIGKPVLPPFWSLGFH